MIKLILSQTNLKQGQAMQVAKIITQLLLGVMHKTRIQSLIPVITGIITSKQLRLTQLGRSLNTPGKERAGIRRVDRFLANTYYQEQSLDIYTAITQRIVGNQGRPIILVDWTNVPNSKRTAASGEHSALRASLIAEGRSLTLYEEIHPKKKEHNSDVHGAFLKTLQSILPAGCRPYVVTDAGFKNPWFKAVLALGWDYVGRVRGCVKYDAGNGFQGIEHLFNQASATPKSLGLLTLAKKNPLKTNCYIYTHKLKGRHRLTKTGKTDQQKDSKNHSRGYREPWLLVSSLSSSSAAKRVVKIYKLRMTIEASFRDIKSTEFGFSLNENKTINAERYTVWFMLASLASLIAWIIGYAAEKEGLHYNFQANTYRHRRVLSFSYLGCQIVRKKIDVPIDLENIQQAAWGALAEATLC
jgi:hypothetical protein